MATLYSSLWLLLPFLTLIFMIATGPVLYAHFWHRYYSWISPLLGILVAGCICYQKQEGWIMVKESCWEYIQFMALIGGLFLTTAGIDVQINRRVTPWRNLALLWVGALLANFVSTTGASMLLIRPFIRLNRKSIRPYHIVFFIFMVSNIGGALTPIGDPPLLMGFLKGVPLQWPFVHHFAAWFIALILLSCCFIALELFYQRPFITEEKRSISQRKSLLPALQVEGKSHMLLLLIMVAAFFLDERFFGAREMVWIFVGILAYLLNDDKIKEKNSFSWAPLQEVAALFFGIFLTMMPVLNLIHQLVQAGYMDSFIGVQPLYWITGLFSSFLDNAPTYISSFEAANQAAGGTLWINQIAWLKAISLGAVFFGGMTYIGNGPNFMIRSIAEEEKVTMPSFFGYIFYYALPFLLPTLGIISILLYWDII